MALPPGAQIEFANHVRNPLPGPAGGVVVYRHDCPVSPMTLRHSIETVRLSVVDCARLGPERRAGDRRRGTVECWVLGRTGAHDI